MFLFCFIIEAFALLKNSEIIGPTPQIAPKKHKAARLWQSGMWRCKRPIEQWCLLPVE
jgi:hypothetical protein